MQIASPVVVAQFTASRSLGMAWLDKSAKTVVPDFDLKSMDVTQQQVLASPIAAGEVIDRPIGNRDGIHCSRIVYVAQRVACPADVDIR